MDKRKLPVRATAREVRRFRLAIMKQFFNPSAGYDLRFFQNVWGLSDRMVRYDWHQAKQEMTEVKVNENNG
ncbi:hypothetical protein ETAA8_66240 [Anatilimnocola aggregata]|uniref:Uncharacterized protein n=1 Tax=Anatilimnocola aggregata TaxID=2528021 RepID=A0A517YMM9_9BACT|nr:hypothetical protein [Anatilimnocola aggregata]QDU31466.1 hypothetical protein ETAA8_66240 [Anatilimnocola aggregata]